MVTELLKPTEQQPLLLFFVGQKFKDQALSRLFPFNKFTKKHLNGAASLHIDNTTVDEENLVFFADSIGL